MTVPLVVITPWYPSPGRPYDGVFVRDAVTALGRSPDDVLVVHLRPVAPGEEQPATRSQQDEAVVHRLDVVVPPRTSRAAAAALHRDALERAAAAVPEVARAETVHAHVGVPGAWAVLGLLGPTTRLVVTEHATFLREVLAMPASAQMYREVLTRAALLLTVGEVDARVLRSRFPAHADRVRAEGNPVRVAGLPFRESAPAQLDRWLYVGNLIPRKGVDRVVRAFALRVGRDPSWPGTLTLVGDGPQRSTIMELAERLGVADRLTLAGRLASTDLGDVLVENDVLVHLADLETFGLTVVEAVAAGLPVVVTRCGGPEETLGGAAAAGLVRFVDVRPEPQQVVEAVDHLAHSVLGVDRAAVRHAVEARFGSAAFGRRLDALLQDTAAPAAGGDGPVVLGLVGETTTALAVGRVLQDVLRHDGTARLLTDLPGEAAAADRRVGVVDLWPEVSRAARHRLVTVLHERLVVRAVAGARMVAGQVAALPGTAGRVGRRAVTQLDRRSAHLPDRVARLQARIRSADARGRAWTTALADGARCLAGVDVVVADPVHDRGVVDILRVGRPSLRLVDVRDPGLVAEVLSGPAQPPGRSEGAQRDG